MKIIIKECKEKTKSQKYREKIYIKKCWNCKSIFTYQNEDIIHSYNWDEFNEVKCPVCASFEEIIIKRRYKKSRLERL